MVSLIMLITCSCSIKADCFSVLVVFLIACVLGFGYLVLVVVYLFDCFSCLFDLFWFGVLDLLVRLWVLVIWFGVYWLY